MINSIQRAFIMKEHIYTSSKGESFLSWDDWARQTLNESDLSVYLSPQVEGSTLSADKLALYARWVDEEQILTHVVKEDDVIVQQSNALK
jgi:hypothetical protein